MFSQYITPKDENSPKEFADCGKLYSECEVPKRTMNVKRRRKIYRRKNVTATYEETTINPTSDEDMSNLIGEESLATK